MTFFAFSCKKQIFILIRFLHAKTTLKSDRRLYKKKWCDRWNKLSQLVDSSRSRDSIWFDVASLILFLKRFEIEWICFWSVISSDRWLSFDLWICMLNWLIRRSLFFWWSEFEYQCAWFERETENFLLTRLFFDCFRKLSLLENNSYRRSIESEDFVIIWFFWQFKFNRCIRFCKWIKSQLIVVLRIS
jgi:hypothetical protein